MTPDEIRAEILWFESLRDAVEDDEKEDALKAIDGAIKIRKKELKDSTFDQ